MKKSKLLDPICTRCGVTLGKEISPRCYPEGKGNGKSIYKLHLFEDPYQKLFEDKLRKKGDKQLRNAKIIASNILDKSNLSSKNKLKDAQKHVERELIETILHKDKVIQRKRNIALDKLDQENIQNNPPDESWENKSYRLEGEWSKEKARNKKLKKIIIWSIVGVVILLALLILR